MDEKNKPLSCMYCSRMFKSQQARWRHMQQSCPILGKGKNGLDILYEHTLEKQKQEIAAREKELEQMRQEVHLMELSSGKAVPDSHSTVTYNIHHNGPINMVHNHVVNRNEITINIFGNENLDHLRKRHIKCILDKALLLNTEGDESSMEAATGKVVADVVRLIYGDHNHKENMTCYVKDKDTDSAMVHTSSGWKIMRFPELGDKVAKNSLDTVFRLQPFEQGYERYEKIMISLRDQEGDPEFKNVVVKPELVSISNTEFAMHPYIAYGR